MVLVTVVAGSSIVFNPAELIIPQESSGTVNIRIEHITDLAGFEWTLTFNPQVLEVVDVTEGNFLKQDGGSTFTPEPEIDNGNGIVSFASGRIAPGGVDGSGVLAQIRFEAQQAGESSLVLNDVKLSDSSANKISAIINSGSVSVPKFPPWDVNLDGVVNIFDIVIVGQNFGMETDTRADVNNDGVVSIFDLVLIGSHFGEVVAP